MIITIILIGCNKDKSINDTTDPYDYAADICSSRMGVSNVSLEYGADLSFECIDGSTVYLKNYYGGLQ